MPDLPRPSRVPVVMAVAAALVAAGAADRLAGHAAPAPAGAVEPLPVAAPAGALSSTWLCAGASAAPNSPAAGTLVVANAGTRAVTATVTLVPDKGSHLTLAPVVVPPEGAVPVDEQRVAGATWVAAEVQLDGGAAAVSQLVGGPDGVSAAPCATSGSASWFLPTGETLVNAGEAVDLFNPYGAEAIVDLTFATDQGLETPGDFQGIDVPAGALVAVDVASHLRRRGAIATTVHARTGRVVATSTEVVAPAAKGQALIGSPPDPSNPTSGDPADPVAGVTLELGATVPATSATWADGLTGNGLDERWTIYNPSSAPAGVTLAVHLDHGQAQPFTFTVAGGQVTTVDANAEARIPPGVGHSTTVQSGGAGVVATRTLTAVAPAALHGRAAVAADPVAARRWLVPLGAAAGFTGDIAAVAQGAGAVQVRATVLGANGPEGAPVVATVPAGGRTVIALPAPTSQVGGVLVEASAPVWIESGLAAPSQSASLLMLQDGVPLS